LRRSVVIRTYRLRSTLTDEDADALEGTYLDERHYDLLIGREDADILRPDGSPLLVFRHKVLPAGACRRAFPALKPAAAPSSNRGAAAGGRTRTVKKDGTRSNTFASKPVLSGTIGYYDREARTPFCRRTEYTRRDVEGWALVQPFIREVNAVFRRELPERYEAQMAAVRRTPAEWVIPRTAFTTVTVNRNWATAVHKDKGDLKSGFGVMSVLAAGLYEGGYLVFPKYRVAVDIRTRDVLLADVHEWHGNTPIEGTEDEYDRISCVFYFRTGMRHCLPPAQELERAKRRRLGEPLR
jgi:hypothetical protein